MRRILMGQLPSVSWKLAALWTCLVVLICGSMELRVVRQLLTERNLATWGTVVAQGISKRVDEEGSVQRRFWVRYSYEVDGQTYEGSTIAHSQFAGNPWVLQKRFPQGARVPVYYRPGAPQEAVLLKGLRGADLALLMFLAPFNLLSLLGWYSVVRSRRERGVVHSFMSKGRMHVRLTGMGMVGAGLCAMWFASFLAGIVGFFKLSSDVSISFMGGLWVLVILTGAFVGLWHRAMEDAGAFDLILDNRKERLSVPALLGRSQRLDLSLSQVQSVTTEEHITKDSEGEPVTSWRPTLTFTANGRSEHVALVDYGNQEKAGLLVNWLRARLRLDRRDRPAPVERLSA